MDIKLTLTDGLKREFSIVVPQKEVSSRVDQILQQIGKKAKIDGFRPGKIPLPILKKNYYGKAYEDAIEHFANEATQKAMKEHDIRPAITPKYDLKSVKPEEDLAFDIKLEVLPEIADVKIEGLKVERLIPEIEEKLLKETLDKLTESQPPLKSIEKDRKVQKGDYLIVDVETENLKTHKREKSENLLVKVDENDLGGFEMQLIGAEKGQTVDVHFTFPEDVPDKSYVGQTIPFTVTVHEIQEVDSSGVSDAWAKDHGFESLEKLKDAIRTNLASEANGMASQYEKRQVLDALAEKNKFDVPPTLVDMEFNMIWHQLLHELNVDCGEHEHANHNHEVKHKTVEEASGKKEEDLKKEYRELAERRVRLGLLLAEIGRKNNVTVPREELWRAAMTKARQFPGQEKQAFEYYTKDERAVASLRAPLFEDKVVEFIVSKADVKEVKKTTQEIAEIYEKIMADESEDAKPNKSKKEKK